MGGEGKDVDRAKEALRNAQVRLELFVPRVRFVNYARLLGDALPTRSDEL